MAYKKEKREQQEIALERIRILFELAGRHASEGVEELARRNVALARSVGMRYNVRIPRGLKGRYCKGCSSYLTAKNSKTRLNSKEKKVEVKCVNCGKVSKRAYK